MIPAERQKHILREVALEGVVSIADLTSQLRVSHMTVRRDIRILEHLGRVRAVPGGVAHADRLMRDAPRSTKAQANQPQKAAIGRTAARFAEGRKLVYLDAGTTTLEVARALADRAELTVVTNDFAIADLLADRSGCRLFHTGGEIDRANRSSVGEIAAAAVRRFNFDVAFLSTTSFGPRGLSSPDEEKAVVKQAVAECASVRVLVTDSSKYGRIAPFQSLDLTWLSAIVTDGGLPDAARRALAAASVEIRIARGSPERAAPPLDEAEQENGHV